MSALPFRNRADAARALADALARHDTAHPLVLAIPRGAVPMGRIIADRLHGELDLILVRKLGAPGNPEQAVGAVDECGRTSLDEEAMHLAGAGQAWVDAEAQRQLQRIRDARQRYAQGQAGIPLAGRTVIVVDDGLATGYTMLAALRMARSQGPAWLVCAVPVAAADSLARMREVADEVVSLATPSPFYAVSLYYRDFEQVEDAEVLAALAASPPSASGAQQRSLIIDCGGVELSADLSLPPQAGGLVIFAHGSGSSRHSLRNRAVAWTFNRFGLATLLVDLLLPAEDARSQRRFDIALLSQRLAAAVDVCAREPTLSALPTALFGASTGAAAALRVAAQRPQAIAAVVCRGGRPDLAGDEALEHVQAPTLLLVGALDRDVLRLNQQAQSRLGPLARLQVIANAGHLFEEPGTLQQVADSAAHWLLGVLRLRACRSGLVTNASLLSSGQAFAARPVAGA